MPDILSPKQRSALNRALKHEELLPLLFSKVKELYWFDAFYDAELLAAENNPAPKAAKEENFFQIPTWPITEYLVASSNSLKEPKNKPFAVKYLDLIRNVTLYTIEHGYGNYRTWWQFSKVIQNIPTDLIEPKDMALVKHWVSDKFERGIIGNELGKWLSALLETGDDHNNDLAFGLLETFYQVDFQDKKNVSSERKEAFLSFDSHYSDKIAKKVARQAGSFLKERVIELFKVQLELILAEQKNDSWSAVWRPAIEDNDQNLSRENADDILLKSLRDALLGYFESSSAEAEVYICDLLGNQYVTIRRVAIYSSDINFNKLTEKTVNLLLVEDFFSDNYRHEMWKLLQNNFNSFNQEQKNSVYEIINKQIILDDDNNKEDGATAYRQSIWLSAIRQYDKKATHLYDECIKIIKVEPDHPDFASYSTVGWTDHKSPIELSVLRSLDARQLVKTLNTYEDPRRFKEPGIEGLVKCFSELVKLDACSLYEELFVFLDLDIPFIYELIEVFNRHWSEKKPLPWEKVWPKLLDFLEQLVSKSRFWTYPDEARGGAFVANKDWIVGSIGRLIESGCKSDEHAFNIENIARAKNILNILLDRQTGEKFNNDSDAVSIAINSPRGRCLEGLINLVLFSCRNANREINDHSHVWNDFEPIFDIELLKADHGEYEFATLVTNYLHNFFYLSPEWVERNLTVIFDQNNYQRWICAMQGYSYVTTLHPGVYRYLRDNGDFIKALDDDNLKDRVDERYIQFITLAYLNGDEDLENTDSLIRLMIARNKPHELHQIIWFLWTFRDAIDAVLRSRVFALWSRFMALIDFDTKQGKKLASQLCHWAVFVDKMDDVRKKWLLAISPYAEEDHNAHDLLESLAKISSTQPYDAHDIWLAMLKEYSYDYPDDAIKEFFRNLVITGTEGERRAKVIAGIYLKHGLKRPMEWLKEIM